MNKENVTNQLWLGYCYFHNGDFPKALEIYDNLTKKPNYDLNIHTYKACCLYALCKFKEGFEEVKKGIPSELNNRVRFHLAYKLGLGKEAIEGQSKLNSNSTTDNMSLAAFHYLKNELEEATEIYKKLFMDQKIDALNIYLAMCYYKQEFFDISLDLVNHYLAIHPDSITATNLKAAIEYSSTADDKKAAQILLDLQQSTGKTDLIEENDILRHNLAVFDNNPSSTTNKYQIFSTLLDIIPEAKSNLIIYYLHNEQINQAYNLVKDFQPVTSKDYILKAIVHCLLGQQQQSQSGIDNQGILNENLRKAQSFFQTIGSSSQECDTIEGRQCMASCFRISNAFNDEVIYLDSIEQYMKDDDNFNWNYGVALAMTQHFKQAEEVLLRVKRLNYKTDPIYLSWLCRCYIMNGKPDAAWDVYISTDSHLTNLYVLSFISSEFYRMGYFFFAFKAYLFLERFDPSVQNAQGKFASAVGLFYQVIGGQEQHEKIQEIIHYLVDSPPSEQINKLLIAFRNWGKENGITFTDEPDMNEEI